MTTTDIKNQLLSHFLENDTFNIKIDFEKIKTSTDLIEFKEKVLETVLRELEQQGYVKNIIDTKVWIMIRSYSSIEQNVSIPAELAELIGSTINGFREAHEVTGDTCDKSNITTKDIYNLVNICHILAEEEQLPLDNDKESINDGEDDEEE